MMIEHISPKDRMYCSRGSIALEAALTLPPLLVIILIFLSAMIHEQRLMVLTAALDQTAAEVSLMLPLQQIGSEALATFIDPSFKPAPNASEIAGEDFGQPDPLTGELKSMIAQAGDSVGQWAGEVALEVLIDQRLRFWLSRSELETSAFDRAVDLPENERAIFRHYSIEVSPDVGERVIWVTCTWNSRLNGWPIRSVIQTPVPVWAAPATAVSDRSTASGEPDNVWMLDNFTRGQALRQTFEANLPYDFPVLSRWNGREATVIHSIDLTAPTYAKPYEIRAAVREKLTSLAQFDSYIYQRDGETITVNSEEIQSRRLVLVIPENEVPEKSRTVLTELMQEAESAGIVLQIVRHGISPRYD